MNKRVLSFLLCLLLMLGLAACNNDESESVSVAPTPPQSEPEPEPEPLRQAYLTGLEKGEDYVENRRITSVMVSNIKGSRPTLGLSAAQIVYEIRTEGGITRFMPVYEDYEKMPVVGPVRSARDQFFQLLLPSWSFYAHEGPNQNQPVVQMMNQFDYGRFDMGPDSQGTMWRDQERRAQGYRLEYTRMTDGPHLADYIARNELDPNQEYEGTIFSFTPYNEEPRQLTGGEAANLTIVHSEGDSYQTQFDYNQENSRYMMSLMEKGNVMAPAIDGNTDEQIGFDNLLVLFAPMQQYHASSLIKVDYTGGTGFYFNRGQYEEIRWVKGGLEDPLRILTKDGGEVDCQLNPGTTYVSVVDMVYEAAFAQAVTATPETGADTSSNA